jgi:acid phosphatase class B
MSIHIGYTEKRSLLGLSDIMKNKLIALLTLAALFILTLPAYAQSASTEDEGSGLPVPLIAVAVGAVILALVARGALGIGSRQPMDDEFDEDEVIEKKRKGRRGGRHIDDDPEAYLIERDQVWDEDGYAGEEDVGF